MHWSASFTGSRAIANRTVPVMSEQLDADSVATIKSVQRILRFKYRDFIKVSEFQNERYLALNE